MKKQRYTPDCTWRNILTVLRSKNNSTIVLSCKKHTNGVSPKCKSYWFASLLLCNSLGFLFCTLIHDYAFLFVDMVIPTDYSNKTNTLITYILLALCWLLIGTIIVFLSFHFTKWIPAAPRNDKTAANNQTMWTPDK